MEDIFKEAGIKKEKLEKEFLELPEIIITGVVGANGPGAGKVHSEKYWYLNLSLIAWKELGREVNNSQLILSKKITDNELDVIRAAIKRESVVQLRVKLSKVSPFGDARAQLISIFEAPNDVELEAILEKFKEPLKIIHPEHGTLTLDRSADWFEGTVNWIGEPIRVSVSLDKESRSPESSIKVLDALYSDASDWSKKIVSYAVSKLLDLKNDSWLMEEQEKLSASNFANAIRLESITVYPDGAFEFWHNDGDLFWGHSIIISGTLYEGPNDADILG